MSFFSLSPPFILLKKKKESLLKLYSEEALGRVNTCNMKIKVKLEPGENVKE